MPWLVKMPGNAVHLCRLPEVRDVYNLATYVYGAGSKWQCEDCKLVWFLVEIADNDIVWSKE